MLRRVRFGAEGTVNRVITVPALQMLKFASMHSSISTAVRLTAASMIAATPGPVPSSRALCLGPETTSGPALV